MHRSLTALAVCALLLASTVVAAQEPAKAGITLQPPTAATYPAGRAVFVYTLEQPAALVEIDVLDAKGAVVVGWSGGANYRQAVDAADRLLLSEALTRPGQQTVTWDLHAGGYFAVGAEGAPPNYSPGPLVPPGHYVVQVTALGQTTKQPFDVASSLALSAARQADLEAQFDLAMQIRGSASAASRAIGRVRALKARVNARLKGTSDAATIESGQALLRRLDEILGTPGEPVLAASGVLTLHNGLSLLGAQVTTGGRPTEARLDRYRILSGALQTRILSLNSLASGSYARFERGDTTPPAPAAFGTATIKFDSKGVDFGPWVRTFMGLVNRSWTIPREMASTKGRVVVTFVVHKSGSVTDIVVATPSDVAAFNDSARKAILAASLAQPLPDSFPAESCPITVTFNFNQPAVSARGAEGKVAAVLPGAEGSEAPIPVGGDIKPPRKIKDVQPVYPPIAQSAKVQGTVIIEATIDPAGKVRAARVLYSIPMLDQAALDAVKRWEFAPTLLKGVPVPVIMTVTVDFWMR
jgi:TonB family protein